MAHIAHALDLDTISSGDSVIHRLDGRVKLLVTLIIIVFTVFSTQLIVPIVMEIYLIIIMVLSKIPMKTSFKRLIFLLIFGFIIIIFQPFIQPGNVIWSYGFIKLTDRGVYWGLLLASRLIVSLTAIVTLSSTSPFQEVVSSLRKFKMPKDMAMILSIMVRFLFMFIEELAKIRKSQKSRNFNIHSKLTPYSWRLRQVGYTVAMMFLKSYEQGERIHKSMVSRGFSENSDLYVGNNTIGKNDYIYLLSAICVIIIVEVIVLKYSGQLGILGINLSIN